MKKIVFLPFLIAGFQLFGQTKVQKQLLEKTIEKYRTHQSVSYDIQYSIKYFDEEKTFTLNSHVEMLKLESDSLFQGLFLYSRKDSLADVIKYYKPDTLLVIDRQKELITQFDGSKRQIFPVTGNVDGSVVETYFLDLDRLQQKLTDSVNKLSYSDSAAFLKIRIQFPDDEEFSGCEETIYIDKKTKTIRRITYRAGYKNQVQHNEWLINNLVFDKVRRADLDSLARSYSDTFQTEIYKPLTEADFKLLENGAHAPAIKGKFFPDYDRTVALKNDKLLILDFWYTSCMPCINTIPQLNRLKQKYGNKIEIVGINPIENKLEQKDKISQFLLQTPMDYPILLVDEVPKEYNVRAYPTLYVIDKNGNVLHSGIGFSENTYGALDSLLQLHIKSNSPDGTWKQLGYGRMIELDDEKVKVYSVTQQHCQLFEEVSLQDFGEISHFTEDTLIIRHGIDQWIFTRLEAVSPLCASASEINKDPETNFEAFWETFNEHYPSFATKGVDWKSVYEKYRPQITSNTSDLELYLVFREMITLIQDGHVKMEVPESIAKEYEAHTRKTKNKKSKYSKMDEFRISKELAELYVDSLRSRNGGMVRYGVIDQKIGYIQVNAMLMLADYDLPDSLDLKTFFLRYGEIAGQRKQEVQWKEEAAGAHALMTSIMRELDPVNSYILDLRFNGGGKDGAALAILNHFSSAEKTVFTKKAREENGFVNRQEIKVVPVQPRFSGNVYLLTSNRTASAAEILVLGSLANPNFTRIGSTTEGVFSSTLGRKLPNGWEFELSNEVYEDLKGTNYEHVGIPADFPFEYAKDKDKFFNQLSYGLKKKKDQAIELVIELEKKKH